jgi:hypothetical protein
MSTPKELHRKAMALVNEAMALNREGDLNAYLAKIRVALPLEVEAATLMRDRIEAEPTRSVLFLGAANLAYTCADVSLAKNMLNMALAGNPPSALKREIEDLQRTLLNSEVTFDGQPYVPSDYLIALRKKAVNFRIEPIVDNRSHAIPLDFALFGLNKYKSSWNGFLDSSFQDEFGVDTYGDRTPLVLGAIRKSSNPLVVNLSFKSFGVSLASDTYLIQHDAGAPRLDKWKLKLFDSFKEDVIDVDYQSEADISRIVKKYDEEHRREIYTPIISMFKGNSPFKVSLTNMDYTRTEREFPPVPVQTISRIAPPADKTKEKTLVLYRVFGMAPEEGTGTIRKQDVIQQDELETAEMKREIPSVYTSDGSLQLKAPIEIKIVYNKPLLSLDDARFGLSLTARENNELMDQFHRHMLSTYDRLHNQNESDLSLDERVIKRNFDEIVFARST